MLLAYALGALATSVCATTLCDIAQHLWSLLRSLESAIVAEVSQRWALLQHSCTVIADLIDNGIGGDGAESLARVLEHYPALTH